MTALSVPPAEAGSPGSAVFDLSVVIVSWNTKALLGDCLRSLYECGGLDGLQSPEVWVIDNASDDGSVALARAAYPTVRLIENRDNVGFARANNQALRQAAGRHVLLLNPDTIVPRGALRALVDFMDTRPEAGACSPLLLNADGSPQFCWARFPGLRSELCGRLDLTQSPYPLADFAMPEGRRAMEPFAVDWVGGACLVARADAIRRIGLLDEGYFMYSEETDWCRRLRDSGGLVFLVPEVTVTHLGGQSSRVVPVATRRRMYRSSLRFYRRSHGLVGAFPAMAVAVARYALFRLRRGPSPPS